MDSSKLLQGIKFSKLQSLFSAVFLIGMYEPVTSLVKQGVLNRDYRWFILFLFVALYIFWNFIRITILMIMGVPAISFTKETITLTQEGYVIEWKDITTMNIVSRGGRGQSYDIVIDVKDPWKYISQIKNPLIRYYRWYAKDYFYKPFYINLNNVEGDAYEIFDMVESYYNKYR